MPEDPNRFHQSQVKDFPFFRRTWNNVVVALLAASFSTAVVTCTQFIKHKSLESLRMEVIKHKEVIDQFLAERTMDLKALSTNLGLTSLTRPGVLEAVFQSLRQELPCFTDLGVIDEQGRHLAYVGPYDLISKNYKNTIWFKAVMESDTYISDVFFGYRNAPHFIIAVKHSGNEGTWIIRATVDTMHFDNIVSEVADKRNGDAFLANRNGIFQTSPRMAGQLMGPSEFKDLERFEEVKLEERHGQIRATAWLKNVPWLCVVQIDQDEIFTELHGVRNIGIFVFLLSAILIALTVLLITNQLVSRLETKRRSIRFLDQQLRHTSYMASSMEMSYGFFREIGDTLANMDITARLIQYLNHKVNSNEIK